MFFSRKIYEKLVNWKDECKGSKAILIEGARRIGKSTVVREFAANEYKSFIAIDFTTANRRVKSYFEDYINDLDTFFMLLSAEFKTKLYKRESLIIFDEVQSFPKAREAIKYLVADGRYDYVETGSLISIKENVKNILIPSEERHLKMFPMDFEEFATALGEENLIGYIKSCFSKKEPLERNLHNRTMLLFNQYLLVGGMPKCVDIFMENNRDFYAVDREKRDILDLYRSDMMKIKSRYRSKVISIFDAIPGFLSRHEKRVMFKNVAKNSDAADYEGTFFWLSDSMVTNECFLCNDPNVGLSLNENRGFIKCYFGDTGLLFSHTFDENELLQNDVYRQILSGSLAFNHGMFYENAVAQMLAANGHKLYFYNHYNEENHRNDMEIDFIISNNSKLEYKIFPVEVKSSNRYKTTSLLKFRDKFKERIGGSYIIHPRNLVVKDDILCIPAYMTFCL